MQCDIWRMDPLMSFSGTVQKIYMRLIRGAHKIGREEKNSRLIRFATSGSYGFIISLLKNLMSICTRVEQQKLILWDRDREQYIILLYNILFTIQYIEGYVATSYNLQWYRNICECKYKYKYSIIIIIILELCS